MADKRGQAGKKKKQGMKMLETQRLPEAQALFTEACQLNPNDAHAWYILGAIHGQLGQLEEAVTATQRSLALQANNPDALCNLGLSLEQLMRRDEAMDCYRKVLALQPAHLEARKNLGSLLNAAGNHAAAITEYEYALKLAPQHAGLHNDLGNALLAMARMEEAEAHYRKALEYEPGFTRARSNLATLQNRRGEQHSALSSLQQLLEAHPEDAGAQHNMGEMLQSRGQLEEAMVHYDAALRLSPDFAEAHNHRGTVLQLLGRHEEAGIAYTQALALRPDYAEAHLHQGNLHLECGRIECALDAYRRALDCQPALAEAWNNMGTCLIQCGRYAQGIEAYEKARTLRSDYREAISNQLMALNYDPQQTVNTLYAAHRQGGRTWGDAGPKPPHAAQTDQRLRIGYVSPDLRTHSVAYFIEPVLLAHDPVHFEIFCYAEVPAPDATSKRLFASVPHWRYTCGLSDEELAEKIRQDRIDILVDLAGHTQGNRLGVFALRPAPRQITYLGYPNTTGVAAMDYRITDAIADPVDQDAWHTEQLYRLADGFLCYCPPHDAPTVTPSPTENQGGITFASFNNLAKLNDTVIATWAEILKAVPDSRLWLKNRAFGDTDVQQRYLRLFAQHGIAASRLHMSGWTRDNTSHLAMYAEVDIALDTFPYNGTTTSCEALWMGVPVIALAGDRHAGRVGMSLLHRLGLAPFCARDTADYVALAVKLANSPEKRRIMREHLRPLMRARLCDATAFTQSLEQAYRDIWSRSLEA